MADVLAWVGHRTEHPARIPPVRYVTEPTGGNPFRAGPVREQRPAAGRVDVDGDGGDPRLSPQDREALLELVQDDEYGQLLKTIPITVPDLRALL